MQRGTLEWRAESEREREKREREPLGGEGGGMARRHLGEFVVFTQLAKRARSCGTLWRHFFSHASCDIAVSLVGLVSCTSLPVL
jgi:hypothetical protein